MGPGDERFVLSPSNYERTDLGVHWRPRSKAYVRGDTRKKPYTVVPREEGVPENTMNTIKKGKKDLIMVRAEKKRIITRGSVP